MLKNYLTEDVFQAGIGVYLHNHDYRSAQSDDLWDSMNEVFIFNILLMFFSLLKMYCDFWFISSFMKKWDNTLQINIVKFLLIVFPSYKYGDSCSFYVSIQYHPKKVLEVDKHYHIYHVWRCQHLYISSLELHHWCFKARIKLVILNAEQKFSFTMELNPKSDGEYIHPGTLRVPLFQWKLLFQHAEPALYGNRFWDSLVQPRSDGKVGKGGTLEWGRGCESKGVRGCVMESE